MDDVTGNLFSLFVQRGEQFWNSFLEYFGLSTWRPQKKFSRSYLQRMRMEEPRQKAFLMTRKCLNWKKSSQKLPSCIITTRGLAVLKMFSWFFFFEKVHTVKQYEASLLRHHNVVKTSVDTLRLVCHFFVLTTFWLICDLLLNRCMATWHLFAK